PSHCESQSFPSRRSSDLLVAGGEVAVRRHVGLLVRELRRAKSEEGTPPPFAPRYSLFPPSGIAHRRQPGVLPEQGKLPDMVAVRSEEHTSELQSPDHPVC